MIFSAPLVFARTLGFAIKAPGLGHPSTPRTVRIVFAVGITLALATDFPRSIHDFSLTLMIAFVLEMAIGAAMGLSSAILYDGAYAGGRMLDDYLGVRTAMPMATVASGAEFGRLWSNVFLAGLLFSGGFERLLQFFAQSFALFPPGSIPAPGQIHEYALMLATLISQAALIIIGPAVASAFLAQVCLGAIARMVPRLSTFALSFPIIYALALGSSVAAMPRMLPYAAHAWFVMPFRIHG